ncbi:MAG: hypothetical protein IJ912_02745 [Fibrobacter sp.]|nr:hypothetical protein [Fibrobacter sp.]
MQKISLICLLLLFFANTFAAPETWNVKPAKSFFKGDGSERNPYVITTEAEFSLMVSYMLDTARTASYYALATDIIINEGNARDWGKKAPKYKWKPIGDSLKPASGILLGQGHTITGLYVNSENENFQGLFGLLQGSIHNLNLVNSFVKGRDKVGALAGATDSVSHVFVEAVVEGRESVGGILGNLYDNISYTTFKGAVKGTNEVGGIFGKSTIHYSHYTGAKNCDNYGTVIGTDFVGGVVGAYYIDVAFEQVNLYKLRNFGNVLGHNYVGGVLGYISLDRDGTDDKKNYNFKFLRNMGEVSGHGIVGGLIGGYYTGRSRDETHSITYSYNAGRVRADSTAEPLFAHGAWHAGYDDVSCLKQSYNFSESYGPDLTAERTTPNLFDNYADSLGPDYLPDTGAVKVNGGYPILIEEDNNFRYLKGNGTAENPFLIETIEDLIKFKKHSQAEALKNRFYYKQTADIDVKSIKNWTPMTFYALNYDGGKHKISNMRSYSEHGCAGFINSADSLIAIKNLELENVSVRGTEIAAALLCEAQDIDISGIKVSGKVEGTKDSSWTSYVGGVVGYFYRGNLIDIENHADVYADGDAGGIICRTGSSSYGFIKATNYGNIFATKNAGGIASYIDDRVTFARNFGRVNGLENAGGIAVSAGKIKHSFNRGNVYSYNSAGGIAAAAKKVEYVYNSGDIYADTIYSSGYLLGCPYYDYRDSVILRHAYYVKKPGVFSMAGKSVLSSDTIGFTQKDFMSRDAIQKMGYSFAYDEKNENDGYPLLYLGFKGEGTPESPFLISTKEELYRLNEYLGGKDYAEYFVDKNFKLTNDIEFDSTDKWAPMGYSYDGFAGVFDGGYHTISGLHMNISSGYGSKASLFGDVRGTIKNLGIENSSFVADTAASMVLELEGGTLENCWSRNTEINGKVVASGIVAFARGDFTINRVFNTNNISTGYRGIVAGIAARIYVDGISTFTNSFNTGKIESTFISTSYNSLTNLYYECPSCKLTAQNLYTTDTAEDIELSKKNDLFPQSIFENVFHLKRNDEDSTGVTEKFMKSKDFVKLLGEEFAYDTQNVNGGFPILSGKSAVLAPKGKGLYKIAEEYHPIEISVEPGKVQLAGLIANELVTLADIKGRVVWKGRPAKSSIAIAVKAPGIYIVKTKSVAGKVLIK